MNDKKGFFNITLIIFLVMFAVIVYFGIKVGPLYFENYQVKSVLKETLAQQQNELTVGSSQTLLKTLVKLFQVNQIKSVQPADVQVGRTNGMLTLSVNYDAKAELYKNLYVVAHFEDQVVAK